ncbi:MAG: L-histidine N(alpha)-methyltransferase [Candidatus Tectomicrobia bacterium]|uniref:L-histidine N(Alpha)-methyltransferase n=1 Tax=Tectimicrobiota bacterium TaxID=2528274 RepID=A0A937W4M5_UNCTE|nr:L-histidine N(alpha)-methyltransferase [Candidatus Tectomicrobia bacterium]
MSVTLTVHASQYPEHAAEQLRRGLRARQLPGKFLYESPAQAQRWLAYHQAYSPSRTEPALLELYQQAFTAALQSLAPGPLHYVSLGCGGGMKDVLGLQQALTRGSTVLFTPMDTSTALVIETMLRTQQALPALPTAPLVVDLSEEPDLEPWLRHAETVAHKRLLACFGMLPNFAYRAFLPYLRRLMRPGDLLLLSANLSPGLYAEAVGRILPQYDNPSAHAWYNGLLDSLGFPATQLQLTVGTQLLRPDGHIWQIRALATVQHALQLALYGETFAMAAGEVIEVFFSNRFTPQVMPDVLAEAGLRLLHTFLFTSQEEAIYLCAV